MQFTQEQLDLMDDILNVHSALKAHADSVDAQAAGGVLAGLLQKLLQSLLPTILPVLLKTLGPTLEQVLLGALGNQIPGGSIVLKPILDAILAAIQAALLNIGKTGSTTVPTTGGGVSTGTVVG